MVTELDKLTRAQQYIAKLQRASIGLRIPNCRRYRAQPCPAFTLLLLRGLKESSLSRLFLERGNDMQ
jgi:hypothetical protein